MNDSDSQSKSELKNALDNMFSVSYITLTSIIQGTVFALLLSIISEVGFDPHGHCKLQPDQWCLTIVALITIVAVWQEYVIVVTVFNWIPGLLDSLIPFALGFAQIGLCFAVKDGLAWEYMSMSVFYLIAVFAYSNMFLRAQNDSRNNFILRKLGNYRYRVMLICAVCAVVHAICFLTLSNSKSDLNEFNKSLTLWAVIPVVFGLLQLVRLHRYWIDIANASKYEN